MENEGKGKRREQKSTKNTGAVRGTTRERRKERKVREKRKRQRWMEMGKGEEVGEREKGDRGKAK